MSSATLIDKFASTGAQLGDFAGVRTATSFGSAADELDALRHSAGVYDLAWRGKLVITGDDRVRWMNGMVTNNIRDLKFNHGNYSFILNAQGRIQADAFVFQRGDYLLLSTELSQLAKVKEYFDRYIIMDDVEVADVTAKLASIGITGPSAIEVLTRAGFDPNSLGPGQLVDGTLNGIGYSISRSPIENLASYEIWLAAENAPEVWDALRAAGAIPCGTDALEWHRILQGIPRYGIDVTERYLPQETGQENALHYSKGCYIGQEIVERIHSRGLVHRVFAGFTVSGAPPAAATKIVTAEKEVGEITSSASIPLREGERTVALGYIRREFSADGFKLSIAGSEATAAALPFKF